MSQVVYTLAPHHTIRELTLPQATSPVIGRVRWGRFSQPFTPAFWRASLWLQGNSSGKSSRSGRSRQGILRETVFCLLGGYGIKAEIAQAFFKKLSLAGLFRNQSIGETGIRRLLKHPAHQGGRIYYYRFPNQKARYLARALEYFAKQPMPRDDLRLREWLLEIPGIGQKTAAWIVRNCLGSDRVAIIDIHLQRAGRLMGLFDARALTARTYAYFEERFLNFAKALQVPASILDLFIWETMRGHPFSGAQAR